MERVGAGKKPVILRYYAAVFVICLIFFYMIPYTYDDWAWGSATGLARLQAWFAGYNGRYLGNLLELLMTRSRVVRTLLMSAVTTAILGVCGESCGQIAGFRTISALAVLFMPLPMFRQTVSWTAGFSNYMTGALALVLYLRIVCADLTQGRADRDRKGLFLAGCFLLTFAGSLFVENLTVYFLMATAVMFVGQVVCRGAWRTHLCLLCGSAAGTVCMFSNTAYRAIARGENYRKMGLSADFFRTTGDTFRDFFGESFLLQNVWVNVCVTVCAFGIFARLRKEERPAAQKRAMAVSCGFLALGTVVGAVYFAAKAVGIELDLTAAVVVTVVYALAVFVFSVTAFGGTERLPAVLFLVVSAGAVSGPLLAASPLSHRCFVFTYFICVLYVGELFRLLAPARAGWAAGLFRLCRAGCVLGTCALLLLFGRIAVGDYRREQSIRRQVEEGADPVVIGHLPFETFLCWPTPVETQNHAEKWRGHFRDFYGIPQDTGLKTEPGDKYASARPSGCGPGGKQA